jgi:hypothetical protein
MARRLAFATFALSFALPVLAQQPVYPSFPPPPAPSGENAPHPVTPDATGDQQNQATPEPGADPQDQNPQAQNPQAQVPQKPSPYPQAPYPDQQYPADGQNYPQQSPYPQQPQQQPPYQQQAPYPQQPSYPPMADYRAGSLGWVPQGMEALGRTAAFHTDFTFDRTMLQLASGVWDGPMDPETASAINRLDGISVHIYHYAAPGMYDPRLLEVVRRQYSVLGWQHLVTAHSRSTGGNTDLWISFHNMRATGAVVLFQSGTNLNLIAFSGNLSPLDLLHLRGHFGIPRFSGDRFVAAPGPSARYAPPRPPR